MRVMVRRTSDDKILNFRRITDCDVSKEGFSLDGKIKDRDKFEIIEIEAEGDEALRVWTEDYDAWGGYRCQVNVKKVYAEYLHSESFEAQVM